MAIQQSQWRSSLSRRYNRTRSTRGRPWMPTSLALQLWTVSDTQWLLPTQVGVPFLHLMSHQHASPRLDDTSLLHTGPHLHAYIGECVHCIFDYIDMWSGAPKRKEKGPKVTVSLVSFPKVLYLIIFPAAHWWGKQHFGHRRFRSYDRSFLNFFRTWEALRIRMITCT